MQLRGLTAAITGASSGIGLACAEHLAREGMNVVLGARRSDLLDRAVSSIRAGGGRAEPVTMDVAHEAQVEAFVEHAVATFGALHVMVCNAGFGYYGTVEETPPAVMQRMMDVNFMGTFYAARAALPLFRARGGGHLILVSSIVAQRGIPMMSGYSATKAAQAAFAEALRAEFAGSGIKVSTVFPVSTGTGFRTAMQRDFGLSISGLGPKQSADVVAGAIVACLRKPVPEVYPYSPARALRILTAVAPRFTDRFVRRFGRRRTVQHG